MPDCQSIFRACLQIRGHVAGPHVIIATRHIAYTTAEHGGGAAERALDVGVLQEVCPPVPRSHVCAVQVPEATEETGLLLHC